MTKIKSLCVISYPHSRENILTLWSLLSKNRPCHSTLKGPSTYYVTKKMTSVIQHLHSHILRFIAVVMNLSNNVTKH